jgi:hypothetical protein
VQLAADGAADQGRDDVEPKLVDRLAARVGRAQDVRCLDLPMLSRGWALEALEGRPFS